MTKEEIEKNSPSRKDGLDAVKEARWRREYYTMLSKAGMVLKIPQWGIATAALLCHRFFSRKSMKKNDRFVIATACLHLAAKMVETPKPIREVVKECERVRLCSSRNPEQHRKGIELLGNPAHLEEVKENVLMAERAVLYTLGFDLNIKHPYNTLLQHLSQLEVLGNTVAGAQGGEAQPNNPYRNLMQNTWNFVNDSFRTTVCIQFEPEQITYAALYLANEMNKQQTKKGIEEVICAKSSSPDTDFFTYFKISKDEVYAICDQILGLYEEVKMPRLQPGGPGQAPRAMSSALPAGSEAAAADGGPPRSKSEPGTPGALGIKRKPEMEVAHVGLPNKEMRLEVKAEAS